jgi:hypothetical protein
MPGSDEEQDGEASASHLLSLKRSYSSYAGQLTKTYKIIKDLMTSGVTNREEVFKKKRDLDDTYEKFQIAYCDLSGCLNESMNVPVGVSDTYDARCREFDTFHLQVKSWIGHADVAVDAAKYEVTHDDLIACGVKKQLDHDGKSVASSTASKIKCHARAALNLEQLQKKQQYEREAAKIQIQLSQRKEILLAEMELEQQILILI